MSRQFKLDDYLMENGKLQSFAFPGGYPIYYLCADGGVLCPDCANENLELIRAAIADSGADEQWEIVAADCNWEDPALTCDNCNKRIESAYAEDETEDETPPQWRVNVGNIGEVYSGGDETQARQTFAEYVTQSGAEFGRASGETVTLLHADEIAAEHIGALHADE